MPSIQLKGFVLFLLLSSRVALAFDSFYQNMLGRKLDETTQNFLVLNQIENINKREKLIFGAITDQQIDDFCKLNSKSYYSAYHKDVKLYVSYLSNRPKYQLLIWLTIDGAYRELVQPNQADEYLIASLLRSRLEYPKYAENNQWQLPYPISIFYGNKRDEFVDYRFNDKMHFNFHKRYYNDLIGQNYNPYTALAMVTMGASTITRIQNFDQKSYWEWYPSINHSDRDFYAALLATEFVFAKMKELKISPLAYKPRMILSEYTVNFYLDLKTVFQFLGLKNDELDLLYRHYYTGVVPSQAKMLVPNDKIELFRSNEKQLALKSTYKIHDISAALCLVIYHVKSGDNRQKVAANFSTTIEELSRINWIKGEILERDALLFIPVLKQDSAFFAAFDTLSAQGIAEQIQLRKVQPVSPVVEDEPERPVIQTSKRTHVVKSGETLSHISRKYGVSVSQIMKWNNLKSTNIQIGQKLVIKK